MPPAAMAHARCLDCRSAYCPGRRRLPEAALARLHERDRADAGVTGVAHGRAIEGDAQRQLPDRAVCDPAQVGLPPTELGDARGGEENLPALDGPAGQPAG